MLFIWCVAYVTKYKQTLSNPSMFLLFLVPCLFPALQKRPEDINRRSADMWSFSVLLWELVTREVPFADLSHMEIGMKVPSRKSLSLHILILCVHLNISRKQRACKTSHGFYRFLCS